MRKLFKNSLNCAFSIIPLLAIFFIINSGKTVTDRTSKSNKAAGLIKTVAANLHAKPAIGLPCGFVATGPKQKPETPTFTTNNEVPILQYPAGGYPGTSVQIPDVVYSEKQNDQLILQSDGNLVIYCTSCTPTKPIWSSQTNGKDGRTLFFQKDGELVLHNSKGKVVWRSNIRSTCAGSEQAYFTLQDDGNLAMLYNETVGIQTPTGTNYVISTSYLGGTASTNDQASPHPGKIQ